MKKRKPVSSSKHQVQLNEPVVLLLCIVFLVFILFAFDAVDGGGGITGSAVETDSQILVGRLIIEDIREDGAAIVVGRAVNDNLLNKVAGMEYEELKRAVGVTAEFSIHFEDDEGNLLPLTDKPCIGSSYVKINGHTCS